GRTTPSVVAFTEDGQRLVGQVARRQAILNPDATIYSAKRFIGRKWGEVDDEAKIVSYKVVKGPNDAVRFEVRGREYAPEEISAATTSASAWSTGWRRSSTATRASACATIRRPCSACTRRPRRPRSSCRRPRRRRSACRSSPRTRPGRST